MTLSDWEAMADKHGGCKSYSHPAGCRYIHQPRGLPDGLFRELWHLSDYLVSSVACGVIWLRPRGKA